MARKNSQGFIQKQVQEQRMVTLPSTILVGQMLERSYEEALQYVNDELEKNPALERLDENGGDTYGETPSDGGYDSLQGESLDYDPRRDYANQDDIPSYLMRQGPQRGADDEVYVPEVVEEESLFEHLYEQLQQYHLTELQLLIGEYVIGNIDSHGYLTRSAYDISYDILTKESLDVSEEAVQEVVDMVKKLEPIGIGASDLRECLLLQLKPKCRTHHLAEVAYKAVERYMDDIANKRYEKLCRALKIDDATLSQVMHIIKSLNSKPGACFVQDRTVQHAVTINPDFHVEYDDESGEIEIYSLNRLPDLQVSESYKLVTDMRVPKVGLRSQKDELRLAKNHVSKAEELITLLKIRQDTLLRVVRAIVQKQSEYFKTLDEADLRPLTLSTIAPIVGSDVSVISRATKGKYIETRNGCLPFKFFFTEGMVVNKGNSEDEEVSTREIIKALKQLIDAEDKSKPLTDQALTDELNRRGYPIKRRTVAKYREERLNIPVARQRKEHLVK